MTTQHLENLLALGIRTFVNLVEEHECNFAGVPIPDYRHELMAMAEQRGLKIGYHRLAFKDMTAPDEAWMVRILDTIDESIDPVFVHCWGGRGRTGTVVGCYLARHGMAEGDVALAMVQYLRRTDPMADSPSPETDDQIAMVRGWRPAC